MGKLRMESRTDADARYGGHLTLIGWRDEETGERFLEVIARSASREGDRVEVMLTVPVSDVRGILKWLEYPLPPVERRTAITVPADGAGVAVLPTADPRERA